MQFIDLATAKQHLRVTHSASDEHIQSLLNASKKQASDYLNKTLFEDQGSLDAALADVAQKLTAERVMLVNETVNSAIALLVEYRFFGVSAMGAEKLEKSALSLLHPDRFIVGW